ncbi:prepilin peptidase [Rhizobiaceae bacterium n13]|uniref:Prepilin peptidase n=1 Tax=Ferirhizobium litorale TaxID=2927786 RepID=A0AAE3QH86_9HYPH|nr:prepilin peptidase [Fererhizobium litorale]MDI7862821.1 prepilin peptidase [Fererhizobium litorale]MDI7923925.1 prepilin peptidase [Fererhizobium litorale]
MIEAVIFVVFPICLALAAFTDLFTMTIPNRIPALLLAGFLVVAPFAGLGWAEFGMHLAAGLLVFSVCFALFATNIMGGGDAKLLTAAAVWFGFNQSLFLFLVYVAYLGGVVTIAILMLRARSNTLMAAGLTLPGSLLWAKKIPYGIAIAIGGFLAFPSSPLVISALQRLQ